MNSSSAPDKAVLYITSRCNLNCPFCYYREFAGNREPDLPAAEWLRFLDELGREKVFRLKEGGMGSEDFASYTYELPCAYLLLGAGSPQEDPRYGQPMHNPKVVFNEDVLPLGAALLTAGAMHRLER